MDIGSILLGQMEKDKETRRQKIQQIIANINDISKQIFEIKQEKAEKLKFVTQFDKEIRDCNREIEESIQIKSPRELKIIIADQKTKISDTEFKRSLVLQEIAFMNDKIRKSNRNTINLLNKIDIYGMEIEEIELRIEKFKK